LYYLWVDMPQYLCIIFGYKGGEFVAKFASLWPSFLRHLEDGGTSWGVIARNGVLGYRVGQFFN